MAQILVRDLEPEIVAELKSQAERNRRSLQSEVRIIIEDTVRREPVDVAEIAKLAAEIRAETRGRVHTNSVDMIREDRDR